jgi:hypothetical protein
VIGELGPRLGRDTATVQLHEIVEGNAVVLSGVLRVRLPREREQVNAFQEIGLILPELPMLALGQPALETQLVGPGGHAVIHHARGSGGRYKLGVVWSARDHEVELVEWK